VTDGCDDRDALREQYADGENLESRIALHRDYAVSGGRGVARGPTVRSEVRDGRRVPRNAA
jgi:hypothetical protein